jgi:hypothetical protein
MDAAGKHRRLEQLVVCGVFFSQDPEGTFTRCVLPFVWTARCCFACAHAHLQHTASDASRRPKTPKPCATPCTDRSCQRRACCQQEQRPLQLRSQCASGPLQLRSECASDPAQSRFSREERGWNGWPDTRGVRGCRFLFSVRTIKTSIQSLVR